MNIKKLPPVVFVVIIVFVGLYLRFSLFLDIAPFSPQYEKTLLTADAPAYYNLAKSLAENNCFDLGNEKMHALWAPGFPFFASIIFRLTSEKIENVILAQIIISALLPVLFFYYTRDIFSSWLRFAVAGLFTIEPNSIIFANLFLSETIFVTLLLCFFLAYCRFLHNRFLPSLILSAVFLGLATLIRAVNQYLFIVIAFHLLVSLRHQQRKTILQLASIFFIAYALIAGSWMMRNYYHWNSFKLSSGMGYNLIMNNISITDAQRQRVNKKNLRDTYFKEADRHMEPATKNPFEIDAVRKAWALNRIKNDFSGYFSGHIEEIKKIYFDHNEFIMFFNNYLGISVFDYKTKPVHYQGNVVPYRTRTVKTVFQNLQTLMTWFHILATSVFIVYLVSTFFLMDPQLKYVMVCAIIMAYFPVLSSASAASRFRVPIVYYLILGAVYSLGFLTINTVGYFKKNRTTAPCCCCHTSEMQKKKQKAVKIIKKLCENGSSQKSI